MRQSGGVLVATVVGAATLVGGAFGLARRWLLVVRVHGQSMSPTYQPGDAVLARRRRGGELARGSVVICRLPPEIPGPDGYLVKRVVAVGGDPIPGGANGARVPAGQVFLQGDNPASYDSRSFGPIDVRFVRGRVIGLHLPFRSSSKGL